MCRQPNMLFSAILACLWLSLGSVHAAASPLVLDLVAEHRTRWNHNSRLARRRSGPVAVDIDGTAVSYYANGSLGTPPQDIRFIVDTNSADLLALARANPACDGGACSYGGTYKPNSSSTYNYVTSNFSITFEDGSTSRGDYATDKFTIGGTEIDKMKFAIGYDGNLTDPILGIGYIGLEQSKSSYANLPVRMFNKGLSNIVGYSLWFQRPSKSSSSTARLVFGGIDTNQFYGTLETIPIDMKQLQYQYVTVQLSGLAVTTGNQTTNITNSPRDIVLDSGTTSLVLRSKQVSKIGDLIGAINDTSIGGYYVKKYAELDNSTVVNLRFGATNISVPLPDLVLAYNDTWALLDVFASPDPSGIEILGLPFFRNAYTVFDYSHNQVSLAPLVHGNTASNVTMINQNGVAGLTGVSLSDNSSGGDGLSTGAKAGIGVGVALGVLLILGLILFFSFRHRRSKRKAAAKDDNPNGMGKAELPAAENERPLAEEYGSNLPHQPGGELSGSVQPPPAELYPGLGNSGKDGQHFEPQELLGDVPRPQELATEHNLSGAGEQRGVTDSAVSDLSGATPSRVAE
ncbi:uncharacterized protein Z518_04641 [Rhinocladiella mackenziei CBS 650.93]|uniref:Peptidase A1 domain-containing protein n=1 Tax=Rhinocladiella mackenziei CBS 650.93 TaxID=1442369 RepID=A0A0D2JC41_9EURO|nr:uncharacterized protein Z518_04641 [Rhinocladiella mackenziei CBS 650.93]KIX06665.1 hypothetical protein Z518_04641 [Rhinocladiella mackenziei CBS 650.93]